MKSAGASCGGLFIDPDVYELAVALGLVVFAVDSDAVGVGSYVEVHAWLSGDM